MSLCLWCLCEEFCQTDFPSAALSFYKYSVHQDHQISDKNKREYIFHFTFTTQGIQTNTQAQTAQTF